MEKPGICQMVMFAHEEVLFKYTTIIQKGITNAKLKYIMFFDTVTVTHILLE